MGWMPWKIDFCPCDSRYSTSFHHSIVPGPWCPLGDKVRQSSKWIRNQLFKLRPFLINGYKWLHSMSIFDTKDRWFFFSKWQRHGMAEPHFLSLGTTWHNFDGFQSRHALALPHSAPQFAICGHLMSKKHPLGQHILDHDPLKVYSGKKSLHPEISPIKGSAVA